MSGEITEATRRDIFDYLTTSDVSWSGRLTDREFLSRLYDLEQLPSTDHRLKTAAGDIAQHTESFSDWEKDWVFTDRRFNLFRCSDEELLRFLVETVHPIVRQDAEEAREMVRHYNLCLSRDGWTLLEVGQLSGRPLFRPARFGERAALFDEPTGWRKVDRQLQQAKVALLSAVNEEDFQAVGLLCREVLISASEHVYDPKRHRTLDDVSPSNTDAKRLLEAIFEAELEGGANEEARAHARGAVKLAYALQHKRTADSRLAALCLEATVSVVNLLAIIAGKRSLS